MWIKVPCRRPYATGCCPYVTAHRRVLMPTAHAGCLGHDSAAGPAKGTGGTGGPGSGFGSELGSGRGSDQGSDQGSIQGSDQLGTASTWITRALRSHQTVEVPPETARLPKCRYW